jgi:hypothetical protein
MMGKAALGKAANGISGRVSKVRTVRFPNPSPPCFTSTAGDCCPYIAIYKTDLTLFVHNHSDIPDYLTPKVDGEPQKGKPGSVTSVEDPAFRPEGVKAMDDWIEGLSQAGDKKCPFP